MSAHASLPASQPPAHAADETRWGVRLRELAAESSAAAPEPLDWQPTPPLRQRLLRAFAVPSVAAAAVFAVVVLPSILMVWLRPHGIDSAAHAQPTLSSTQDATELGTSTNASIDNSKESSSRTSTSTPTSVLFVHVVGEVAQPGVYELRAGDRVLAAIEAAGGATDQAVLSALNLARALSDGEQLVVPDAQAAASGVPLPFGNGTDSPAASSAHGGLVNLNTADSSALETLPRVGPALAQRIIDWREANGGFQNVDQLTSVSGIGQRTFEQLQALVTV